MGCGWVGGFLRIMPLRGSILQAGTCQIPNGHRTKYLFKKIHMVGRVVLSDLPDSQLGCESKMEPSVAISITRWNLPDSHLCLKSKTEPCVANAPNYIGGGHRTYSVDVGNNWSGDTAQHLKKELKLLISNWWGGVAGWSQLHNIATSWLHLASWNLPDSQHSWESKMEPECDNWREQY